jgi:hypothetical protein
MRKDFFSGFSDLAKDGTDFFPNSNLIRNKFDISIHPVISRKKYGSKCETLIHENGSKILEFTKIFENNDYNCHFRPKNVAAVNWPMCFKAKNGRFKAKNVRFFN